MANYTAADVKKLRELTGSGMMDCKNALVDTDGNFDAAVDLLRIKGAKDVGKRATRSTSNGLVAIRDGLALELACETDFVAKNADFQALGDQIVDAALAGKADDAQAALGLSIGAQTVAEAIHDVSAKIGEKIELRRLARIEGNTSAYLHRKSADLPPQVGVLVGFTGNDPDAARSVGMQIAAMKPRFVTREEVPADVVEKERQIAETKFREEGKPEQAIAKIAEGVVNKYYKENVLLEQESVQDSKKNVKQILEGTGVTVTRFVRYEVGQE